MNNDSSPANDSVPEGDPMVNVRMLVQSWVGPELYGVGDTLSLPASLAREIRDSRSPPLLEII